MLRRTWAAYRGHRLWSGLDRRYALTESVYVLLMPDDDAELNALALQRIGDLLADRRASGTVLVADLAASSTASLELVTVPQRVDGVIGVELWTGGEIDALLAAHELGSFTDRLLFVSLTKPFGNNLHRLLGRQGVTKEDLLCLGCLRLRGYGMVPA